MKQKKKNTLLLFLTIGIVFIFRAELLIIIDLIFKNLTDRSLINRSQPTQLTVLFLISFLFLGFIFLVQNNFLCKIDIEKSLLSKITIFIPLIVIFVLFIILAWNMRLRRDDYWEIFESKTLGQIKYILTTFQTSTFRYASLFFKSFYSYLSPNFYINISLIFIFILQFFGLYLINKLFLDNFTIDLNSKLLIIFSIVLSGNETVGILILSPKVWEVHFWGAGTFVYSAGLTLSILAISVFLMSVINKHAPLLMYIFSLILSFFACGCSELVTISMYIFTIFLLFFSKIQDKTQKQRIKLIVFCIFTWLSGLISITAPGGQTRAKDYMDTSSIIVITENITSRISEAILTDFQNIINFFNYQPKLLFIFLVISLMLGMLIKIRIEKIRELFIIFSVLIITAIISLLPNAILRYIPARVLAIPWTWMFLSFSMLFFLAGALFIQKFSMNLSYLTLLLGTAIPMIIFCWFYFDNIRMAKSIRLQWDYRNQILQGIDEGTTMVETCQIPVLGSTQPDISEDPNYEGNITAALFYKVKTITAYETCERWMMMGKK